MLKYLITGTGRCGTGYMAQVFKSAGVPCGHEAVFSYDGPGEHGDWQADSSWLAAPFLPGLEDTTIIHLVRDPRKIIESLVSVRVLSNDTPYSRFAFEHLPYLRDWARPEEQAAQFYLGWNRMIEPYADVRHRVEDDPFLLLDALLIDCDDPLFEDTAYNHRPEYPPYELDWLALDSRLRDELAEMGQRYGYL